MITVILLKLGYAAVGAVVGWLAAQLPPSDRDALARVDELKTPTERLK